MATQYDPTIFGYQNFYSAVLTADITSGSLTISLDTVPSPTAGILIIEPDSTTSREIILYTSKGASTVTCPSDGRGWGGSSAASHLTGSTVIMAPIKEFFAGLADGTLSTDPARQILIPNHINSGAVVAQSSGLIGTFSNIVFYLSGQRYSGTSIANKTYTASKDTYVDVTAASGGGVTVTYSEVTNGAAAPSLAANNIRVAKVVTNGSAITSVVQYGQDGLGNTIYPTFFANPNTTHIRVGIGSTTSTPAANAVIGFDTKIYDTLGEWSTSNKKFTATKAGLYLINAQYWWGSAGAGATEYAQLDVRQNGSTVVMGSERMNGSGDANRLIRPSIIGCIYLQVGDTIDFLSNATNAVRDIPASSVYSFAEIHRIA